MRQEAWATSRIGRIWRRGHLHPLALRVTKHLLLHQCDDTWDRKNFNYTYNYYTRNFPPWKTTKAPLVIFAHNVDSPIHQGASSRSHSASSPATWFQYFHLPSSGDLPVHSLVYRKGHSKRSSWPCHLRECPGPKVRSSKSLRMVTGLDNAFVSKFASGRHLFDLPSSCCLGPNRFLDNKFGYWMESQIPIEVSPCKPLNQDKHHLIETIDYHLLVVDVEVQTSELPQDIRTCLDTLSIRCAATDPSSHSASRWAKQLCSTAAASPRERICSTSMP